MKWFHGEFRDRTGKVSKFRYPESDDTTARECIHKIKTRYMEDNGITIVWIKEGFIPENTEIWGGWSMAEPDDYAELVPEQRIDV